MSRLAKSTTATVIPCVHYRDASAAMDSLCEAFGFENQAVYSNADGAIAHAQLTFGNDIIMPSSIASNESEWARLIEQPDGMGGAETQSAYLTDADAHAVYAKAKATGATLLLDQRRRLRWHRLHQP